MELREKRDSNSCENHGLWALNGTLDIIKDTQVVLVSQIGPGASQFLLSHGIQPFMVPTFIEKALQKLATRVAKNPIKTHEETNFKAAESYE